jgi:hypothetical protein
MSPRSPDDRREDDMQDKVSHAVHDTLNEAHAPAKTAVSQEEIAHAEKAEKVQCVETTVELDRVALYLKGPTAFSA